MDYVRSQHSRFPFLPSCKVKLKTSALCNVFVVIDDGSLTDDMLYEIINNLTKSKDDSSHSSTSENGKQGSFLTTTFFAGSNGPFRFQTKF